METVEKKGGPLGMEYNSQRPDLVISEYGRNIQKMVEHAMSIEDREERNKVVRAIISVMGQLFPYLRDVEDFTHKLWDHLHIISDFKLDVDSPYPKPTAETFKEKPQKVEYPDGRVRYGHYGKTIPALIKKATEMEAGDKRNTLVLILANLMKKHYVTWTNKSAEDQLIKDQLKDMSNGELSIPSDIDLVHVPEPHQQHQSSFKGKKKKGGKKGGGKRRN